MIGQAFQVTPNSRYQRSKPHRNPRYLAFVRAQASVVSGRGGCDPCHVGPHGLGQKASDLDTIPLTRKEHDAFDADPAGFAKLHGLDIPAIVARLNAVYFSKCEGGS